MLKLKGIRISSILIEKSVSESYYTDKDIKLFTKEIQIITFTINNYIFNSVYIPGIDHSDKDKEKLNIPKNILILFQRINTIIIV